MSDFELNFPANLHKDWEDLVAKEMKSGDAVANLRKTSMEGIDIEPLYSSDNDNHAAVVGNNLWKVACRVAGDFPHDYKGIDALIFEDEKSWNQHKQFTGIRILEFLPGGDFSWDDLTFVSIDPKSGALFETEPGDEIENWLGYAMEENLQAKTIAIALDDYALAGANSVQQLAIFATLVNGYVEDLGVDVLKNIWVKIAVGSDFFMEISKLRALRVVWANLCSAYGCDLPLTIWSVSSLRNKSLLDKYNNVVRSTFETAASVIGNADFVEVQPYDILYKQSRDFSREIALKQQFLLKEESYFHQYTDPMAGSYFVENLTRQLGTKAWSQMQEWEQSGGWNSIIEKRILHDAIAESAAREEKSFDSGQITRIGVNKFAAKRDFETDEVKNWKELSPNSEQLVRKPLSANMEADFES